MGQWESEVCACGGGGSCKGIEVTLSMLRGVRKGCRRMRRWCVCVCACVCVWCKEGLCLGAAGAQASHGATWRELEGECVEVGGGARG